MGLIATVGTGEQFEPAPTGTYAARIKDIMLHEPDANAPSQFADQKPQVKIVLTIAKVIYTTPNRPSKDYPNPTPAEGFVGKDVFAYCNFDPTPRNTAGKWISQITGEELVPGAGFDWHSLLRKPVVMTVGRSQNMKQKITDLTAYVSQGAAPQPSPAPQTTTLPQPAAAADDPWDAEPFGDDADELPF